MSCSASGPDSVAHRPGGEERSMAWASTWTPSVCSTSTCRRTSRMMSRQAPPSAREARHHHQGGGRQGGRRQPGRRRDDHGAQPGAMQLRTVAGWPGLALEHRRLRRAHRRAGAAWLAQKTLHANQTSPASPEWLPLAANPASYPRRMPTCGPAFWMSWFAFAPVELFNAVYPPSSEETTCPRFVADGTDPLSRRGRGPSHGGAGARVDDVRRGVGRDRWSGWT